jgi:hypothetical protein
MGLAVTMVILIVNVILKNSIIRGANWVGDDRISTQMTYIINRVFVAQFFNTGILIVLVNGNLTEHSPKLLT